MRDLAIILGVITAFAFVAALVALRIIGRHLNPPGDAPKAPSRLHRIKCFIFHWRRQWIDADTHYYGWKCGICGERWLVGRGPDDYLGDQITKGEWPE